MNSRNAQIGAVVAALVIVVGVAYAFMRDDSSSPNTNNQGAMPSGKTYANEEYGITFTYPEGYELAERDLEGSAERKRHIITLIREEDLPVPENGEGPPSISILFVQNNLDSMTTDAWVRGSSDSNFKLSPDKGTAQVNVGGKDGLIYRWDGLYQGETTAVAGTSWVYAFSVTFDGENDPIVSDYRKILNSVTFAK